MRRVDPVAIFVVVAHRPDVAGGSAIQRKLMMAKPERRARGTPTRFPRGRRHYLDVAGEAAAVQPGSIAAQVRELELTV